MTDMPSCPFCMRPKSSRKYKFETCAIHQCSGCDLMFLHPKPSVDALSNVYDDRYFVNKQFLSSDQSHLYGYVDYIAERINKQYGYSRIVSDIRDRLATNEATRSPASPRWLDVGCGLGYLLDVAFDQGFAVEGIEFNPHAVQYMQSKYTYPVRCATVADMELDKKYDVVSLMDVVEHLYDPFADLKRIRSIIADNGVLLLITMDSGSFVSRALGSRLEDFRRIREHLFFFTRRSMKSVLAECGFTVESVSSIGHTFALDFLLTRFALVSRPLAALLRWLIWPRWLLDANIYINPGTKMLVVARPSAPGTKAS